MNIILIGHKSCGKTSLGKALAIKLEKKFVDTDELIAIKHQQSVREIYEQRGEKYFQKIEEQSIASLASLENAIVATGGGAAMSAANVKIFKKTGTIVYLELSFEEWKTRIEQQPLPIFLRGEKNIFEHYQTRKSTYQKIADAIIKIDQCFGEDVVNIIMKTTSSLQPPASSLSYVP